MITREKFDFIKEKYGHHASWAVWAEPADTSKTNMGDLTILDPEINKDLLSQLNPNIILVALNFSMEVKLEPWGNFHSDGQHRQSTRIILFQFHPSQKIISNLKVNLSKWAKSPFIFYNFKTSSLYFSKLTK